MHVKELQYKLGHAKREIKALQAKIDRVKSIELPEGCSDEFQEGAAYVALEMHKALEPNKRQRGMVNGQ